MAASVTFPPLPNYSDDEVRCFHPIFQIAADRAIARMGLSKQIKVVHHRSFGGIIVDFSFERIGTGRVVLLTEIKRTPRAVESTRYRHQAMSYRKEADAMADTGYYILTNLERADLFRYDSSLPRAASQLIQGSPFQIGSFASTPATFISELEEFIVQALDIALNDKGAYHDNLDKLHQILEGFTSSTADWHKILVPVSYEYVRGAAAQYPDLKTRIDSLKWEAADRYARAPDRLKAKGAALDFANIFCDPLPDPSHRLAFDPELLDQAFASGGLRANGEDVADIINSLLAPRGPGIVETDEELARLLALVAADSLDAPLGADEIICDPAAGSGRLLTAARDAAFPNTTPRQWWANEILGQFAESLSLRLGLAHANTLKSSDAPHITIGDAADLDSENFQAVRVVLMNPPFLSGIQAAEEKAQIARAIHRVSGKASIVNNGQIGLEALFLELILHLVPDGCVIAAIMPYQSLRRKSGEMIAFRRFLLQEFGLTHIVTYPREGLFEQVIKRTVILVGKKGSEGSVKWIDARLPLERLDLRKLAVGFRSNAASPVRGADLTLWKKRDLLRDSADGWNGGGAAKIGAKWVQSNLGSFPLLSAVARTKRGASGNSGASDLSAIPLGTDKAKVLEPLIPALWKVSAINNSNALPKELGASNRQAISPVAPASAFDSVANIDTIRLDRIIAAYLAIKAHEPIRTGSQKKAALTAEKVKESLRKDAKRFPTDSILIPRACRAYGRIGLLNEPHVVSTNFVVASFDSRQSALLAASWFSSVFSQIQMETLNNEQEGVRKLEVTEINQLVIPDFSKIGSTDQEELIKAFLADPAIDLRSPQPRSLDRLWADQLCPGSAEDFMRDAMDLMGDLCEERAP